MTSSKIGNKKCGSLFQRTNTPNTGNAETGCRNFSFYAVCRSALLLDDYSRKNRISNQKCHLAAELPTQKENRGLRFLFSHKGSPLSAKGWSDFRLHNQGIFRLILGLLEAATTDHESSCFTEHPPQAPAHTPSGLRADTPIHHRFSPRHPRADV